MIRIIPGITSLSQHIEMLMVNTTLYRPPQCSQCACPTCWCHGVYHRKTSRDKRFDDADNPIPIPRFICKGCGITFSCLPECVPPKRWYSWAVQEDAFITLLEKLNFRSAAEKLLPGRSTLSRWWHSFEENHPIYADHLKNQQPDLGRQVNFRDFWKTALSSLSLASIMWFLYNHGAPVPPVLA